MDWKQALAYNPWHCRPGGRRFRVVRLFFDNYEIVYSVRKHAKTRGVWGHWQNLQFPTSQIASGGLWEQYFWLYLLHYFEGGPLSSPNVNFRAIASRTRQFTAVVHPRITYTIYERLTIITVIIVNIGLSSMTIYTTWPQKSGPVLAWLAWPVPAALLWDTHTMSLANETLESD